MGFQRLSEGVEGKSRPPESRWKVVPQSRTGGRETPITEFVMCSGHEQLPHVIVVGPQWATTNDHITRVFGENASRRFCSSVSVEKRPIKSLSSEIVWI